MDTTPERRLLALDAFRGATIAGMILVNMPGSWGHIYAPLRHAAWHGATPTDLIFPFFLFVVGTSMWFSFRKFDHRLSPPLARKIVRRVALIFLVGLFLSAYPFVGRDLPGDLRIMGVLQRIALAYGLAAFLVLLLSPRNVVAASAAILLGYWALLLAVGGAEPYALESNVVRRVDLAIFGEAHVWHGFGIPFDPEGLLSTLPAVVTVVMGYIAGRWITESPRREDAILRMLLTGTLLILAGVAWNPLFPINKPLWTGSYVLYTGGIAFVALAWFILGDRRERLARMGQATAGVRAQPPVRVRPVGSAGPDPDPSDPRADRRRRGGDGLRVALRTRVRAAGGSAERVPPLRRLDGRADLARGAPPLPQEHRH